MGWLGAALAAVLLTLVGLLAILTRRRGSDAHGPPVDLQAASQSISERRRHRIESDDQVEQDRIRDALDTEGRQRRLDELADL